MQEFGVLKELLVDELFGDVSKKHGCWFAMLKESGQNAKLKSVEIRDVSEHAVLIKMDETEQPNKLFKENLGQRKRCDYVLLTESFVVFIEMKSKNVDKGHIEQQFKGAECIMDYLNAALTRFHNEPHLLSDLKKRFVLFYKPSNGRKTPTRPIKNAPSSSPENPCKYPYTRPVLITSLL